MRTLVLVFAALCCLQLATATASPGLFGNIFKGVTNAASAVTSTIAQTASTAVNTVTSTFSNTADAIAETTANIPIVNTITSASAGAIDAAENAIDKTAQDMADATTNTANSISSAANNVIDDINTALTTTSGAFDPTNVVTNIDNVLTDILDSFSNGAAVPDNTNNFLDTVQGFTNNLLSGFSIPDLSMDSLAQAFSIDNITDTIATILAGGPLTLPLNIVSNLSELVANISEASPILGLLLLKIRIKLLLAQAALNATNQGLIGAGNAIG